MWHANEFGDRPYIHAIGFNVNEYTRITRDSADSAWYGQKVAADTPYAGNKPGWPEQLARFAALPVEATEHVIDEYVWTWRSTRAPGCSGPASR
jgi:hypothetical protein